MNRLAELQQKRASKVDAQKNLIDLRKSSDNQTFTDEQRSQFNALQNEIASFDAQIEEERQVIEAEKRAAQSNGKPADKRGGTNEGGEAGEKKNIFRTASIAKAIRSATSGKALSGVEAELSAIGTEQMRSAGLEIPSNSLINIPKELMRSGQHTVTEDGGDFGGQLVVDQTPRLQVPFAPSLFLDRLGVTRLTGLTGGDIPLPVGGNYDHQFLTETAEVALQKQEFDGPKLSPKRLAAAVRINNRLLMQTSLDAEGFVRRQLFDGRDRSINAAAINGTGLTVNPRGILNTPGVSESAIATAAAKPTYEMIVELIGLITQDNATENSLGWLMSPKLRSVLMSTRRDTGSGLMIQNLMNELLGMNVAATSLVPDLAGNKVLIHGDFSQLFVGEWGGASLVVDYSSGLRANAIEIVVNSYADVQIAQPKAFAVNRFIDETAS